MIDPEIPESCRQIISENRSDFVLSCIYTADLKSTIKESKDKAQPTTKRE